MAGLEDYTGNLSSNLGTVRFTSNGELDRMENERILADRPKVEPLENLTSHIRDFWQSAKTSKITIQQDMLSNLRRIKGEYEPDKLQAIRDMGGSDDFIRLSQHKTRDTEAWIVDVLNPAGDRTWDIEPEFDPDIPPDIEQVIAQQVRQQVLQRAVAEAQATGMPVDAGLVTLQMQTQADEIRAMVKERASQLAEERATNMEKLILDQLAAGGWEKAFRACINDLSRFKSCVIKGPCYHRKKTLKWGENPQTGKWEPVIGEEIIPVFDRVSPFDWYPAPNSTDVNDGDGIELEHLERKDLADLLGVPGYKDEAIRNALRDYINGHSETTDIDAERFALEKDNTVGFRDVSNKKLDLLNYWGQVPGKYLLEWGMTEEDVPDADIDYQINAKVIGKYVVKAVINPDPLGNKPYGVTSFVKSNDSQWGECPGELMVDIQNICNATVRALVNNIATSSGPLTEIDIDRLAPGETPDIWPHKVIQTTNKRMAEGPAVKFYQANLLAKDLLLVYDRFKREADDLVVPSYAHGNPNITGAGKTSSGLAMLMGAAARNIKLAISNVDQDLIIPTIERLFNYNMRFIEDESIKGALKVKARGAGNLLVKEQLSIRRREFLAETLNPVDQQIMGVKGRAYILGENVKALDMDVKKALPNLETIEKMGEGEAQMQMQPMMPQQGTPEAQPATDMAGQTAGGADYSLFKQEATA